MFKTYNSFVSGTAMKMIRKLFDYSIVLIRESPLPVLSIRPFLKYPLRQHHCVAI